MSIGPADDPGIRYVAWWFVVERGREQEWEHVAESARQIADAGRTEDAWIAGEVAIDSDEDRAEVLYRVTLMVEWYGQATTHVGGAEVTGGTYRIGSDGFFRVTGCPALQRELRPSIITG